MSLSGKKFNSTSVEEDCGLVTYRSKGYGWIPSRPKLNQKLFIKRGLSCLSEYIEKHGKPDIIHVQSSLISGIIAQKAKNKYKIPYVITEHFSGFISDNIPSNRFPEIQESIYDADGLVAVSNSLAECLRGSFHNLTQEWQVIPNLVSDIFLDKPIANGELSDTFQFVVVANLIPRKQIDKILLAFDYVYESDKKIDLVIIGSGPELANLRSLANGLASSKRIQFLGSRNKMEVADYMARSDVVLSASTHETFGVTLIEGLALGIPIITTKSGGPSDIVNESNGKFFNSSEPAEMAQVMLSLKSKIDNYDRRTIRENCRANYSADSVCRLLEGKFLLAKKP
jgi:glycosyltransferase involved in cell wall biosynthesis